MLRFEINLWSLTPCVLSIIFTNPSSITNSALSNHWNLAPCSQVCIVVLVTPRREWTGVPSSPPLAINKPLRCALMPYRKCFWYRWGNLVLGSQTLAAWLDSKNRLDSKVCCLICVLFEFELWFTTTSSGLADHFSAIVEHAKRMSYFPIHFLLLISLQYHIRL